MIEVKAPQPFDETLRPRVFLAGSIDMDRAVRWQDEVVAALKDRKGTILNPRRDDWDASWNQSIEDPQFRAQVDWELVALESCDLILMYFAPGSQAPITLLEFGLHARSHKLVVCCPDGYWRKGNIDIVCARFAITTARDLPALIEVARAKA